MNKKCQVFTPADYVEELLDSIGYTDNLYGKKIIENSCGDGNILVGIVQRYIKDCNRQGFSKIKIKNGLIKDIYGIEIDPVQCQKCKDKLNDIIFRNKIEPIKWNIIECDYLKWDSSIKFQFVVGNPPYITYQELIRKEQVYLKTRFKTCKKGKFDYCYAFIEKSIDCLEQNGKMAYLIPCSIFKTVFGQNLRDYMKPYIEKIKDYTHMKMFDNALVKSSIIILNKNRQSDTLHYMDVTTSVDLKICTSNLSGKWFFTNNLIPGTRRFGDFFQVSHVVATLLNEAYVIKEENYVEMLEHYLCNGHSIEKEIVRETATPRSLHYKKKEKIIFPYTYLKDKLIRYTEKELLEKFPGAYSYLSDFRSKLENRESDVNAKWFEYGRSQALTGLNKRKLLISTIITDKVAVYTLNKSCIPYAGMYIVPRESNKMYKLNDAKQILESTEFMQYVSDIGIHISGSSLRITSKDIENFKF